MLMSLLSGVDDYETSDYEADTGRPTGRRPDQEGNDDDDHVEDADDNDDHEDSDDHDDDHEDHDDHDDDEILKAGGQGEGKPDVLELFHLDLHPVTGTASSSSSSSSS